MGMFVLQLQTFTAIAYGEKLMGKDINELNSQAQSNAEIEFHPKHCILFKCSVYHEIAHLLDFILNLSRDPKLYELIKEKSDNFSNIDTKISEYALNGKYSDIIAEAFAEYMVCPESNDLISSIGTYINKKYKLFEDSKLFKINQKFFTHFIKAEESFRRK